MSTGSDLITLIASRQNLDDYQKKHWSGTFAEYLDIVRRDPTVTRTAYQRIFDMIVSHGTEEIVVNKKKSDYVTSSSWIPKNDRAGCHLRPRTNLDQSGQHSQER